MKVRYDVLTGILDLSGLKAGHTSVKPFHFFLTSFHVFVGYSTVCLFICTLIY